MKNKIRGISLVKLLVFLAILGVVGVKAAPVLMLYVNQSSIKGIVKNAVVSAKSDGGIIKSKEIKTNIIRNLDMNSIKLDGDSISVINEGRGVKINVEYLDEVIFTSQVKLVIDLSFSEFYEGNVE